MVWNYCQASQRSELHLSRVERRWDGPKIWREQRRRRRIKKDRPLAYIASTRFVVRATLIRAAKEAVLRVEEVDYSEGGDDFRHWDYFWTNVFNQNRVVAQCQPQRVPRS